VELIIVDDASTDDSADEIQAFIKKHPATKFIQNEKNIGICTSFNKAFHESNGEFLIDLAADDLLLPNRISIGLEMMTSRMHDYAVHYSDALVIDKDSKIIGKHSALTPTSRKWKQMPEGNIFAQVLARYFICPPTVMSRRIVLEHLGGYDERLTYEDFDFLVRASRTFDFCYSDEALVKRRLTPNSASSKQYVRGNKDLMSTYHVCNMASKIVRTPEERSALKQRLGYECRQAIKLGDQNVTRKYLELMRSNRFVLQSGLYQLGSLFRSLG